MSDVALANAIIDKNYSSFIVYDTIQTAPIAQAAVQYVYAERPGVAFHVLSQMQKRGFASSDIVHVARGILDGIEQGWLNKVATNRDGMALVRLIGVILKVDAAGNANSPRATKIKRAIESARPQPKGPQPRKLSQAEMDWYEAFNKKTTKSSFDPSICWDLPDKGTGFAAYNIDDLKGKKGDVYGYDQIGTKETIDTMLRIAEAWHKSHPDRLLQYGDISRPGGIDTPDHQGHQNGAIFDIRPLRNDSKLEKLTLDSNGNHPNYDRELTKECITLIKGSFKARKILFNDPVILRDSAFKSFVFKSDPSHFNHFHVEL